MIDAHHDFPHTTAIAAGSVACARGSRRIGWLPGMASRIGPFGAILLNHRGVSR